MCLNYNNNITVASFTGATAMTRVSTSGQCTYLYKVRQTPKDTRTGCQLFQSTYLYKVRQFQQLFFCKLCRFNPRTYIRYDLSMLDHGDLCSCFNPRTYIRYDFVVRLIRYMPICFNPRTYIRYDTIYCIVPSVQSVSIHVPI